MPTTAEVGRFLEEAAKLGEPITYGDVVAHFPDLPPLTEYWLSHPLCNIFGELDGEDHDNSRPFRTAIVIARERNKPGPGFFTTISRLRGIKLREQDYDALWLSELGALQKHYRQARD